MDHERARDFHASIRMRARSQPPMPERSMHYERPDYHERSTHYERPTYHERPQYARVEERRMERESSIDPSESKLSISGDDDSYHGQRPGFSSRIRRNTSTPNFHVVYDTLTGNRGRSRSRGPIIVDETVEKDFAYRPRTTRSSSRGQADHLRGHGVYDELPSMSFQRPHSQGHLFGELSHATPFYEPLYEGHLFQKPSYERAYEIPSFEGRQLQIESEEQVISRRYESGSYIHHWKEPIKFKAHDVLLKPIEWQAKLEIMEAQVLHHSSFRDFSRHMHSLELDRFFVHIAHADRVIYKVILNLKRMKEANYCSDTFNILVIEKQRPTVARLVGISLNNVTAFSVKLARFLLREGDLPLHEARSFLATCYDFLLAMELDLSAFRDSYGYHSDEGIWYTYVRSKEGILSAIMYATRVIVYLLDIATVSFCGAHLEPFDEVYFERFSPTSHYRLPCDAHGAAIHLQPRTFQCLEGFLQGRSVWVFSTGVHSTEMSSNDSLYLSTTPDEFANVWGPMWKSVSPRDDEITLRYMVSPGFIIPWRCTPGQPVLLPDEVHCHWTKDNYDFDSIFAQTVYGRIERLLIGAHLTLLQNRSCRPNKEDFYSTMSRKLALKDLGFEHGSWTIGPINVSAAISTSALLPVGISTTFGTTVTKKPQKSLRELLCTAIIVDPRGVVIQYLNEYCGVEISACTGHARRIRFCKVLGSQTLEEYLQYRIQWSPAERQDYFRALQEPDSRPALDFLYRHGSDEQKKNYDEALKLSIAALAETRVKSGHLRALWALEGKAYTISFKVSDHKWAGLLNDTLTTCSLVIVTQTCLECSTKVTRHPPEVPVGKPTVFETTLVINPEARLPVGLKILRNSPNRLSEGQIFRRLKEGDTFDIKDHGRVRVLRTLVDATGRSIGVFVELIKAFIPAGRQSVKNFFLKVRGRDQLDTFHREYKDNARDKNQSWFFVFVVSDPRQAGPWR